MQADESLDFRLFRAPWQSFTSDPDLSFKFVTVPDDYSYDLYVTDRSVVWRSSLRTKRDADALMSQHNRGIRVKKNLVAFLKDRMDQVGNAPNVEFVLIRDSSSQPLPIPPPATTAGHNANLMINLVDEVGRGHQGDEEDEEEESESDSQSLLLLDSTAATASSSSFSSSFSYSHLRQLTARLTTRSGDRPFTWFFSCTLLSPPRLARAFVRKHITDPLLGAVSLLHHFANHLVDQVGMLKREQQLPQLSQHQHQQKKATRKKKKKKYYGNVFDFGMGEYLGKRKAAARKVGMELPRGMSGSGSGSRSRSGSRSSHPYSSFFVPDFELGLGLTSGLAQAVGKIETQVVVVQGRHGGGEEQQEEEEDAGSGGGTVPLLESESVGSGASSDNASSSSSSASIASSSASVASAISAPPVVASASASAPTGATAATAATTAPASVAVAPSRPGKRKRDQMTGGGAEERDRLAKALKKRKKTKTPIHKKAFDW